MRSNVIPIASNLTCLRRGRSATALAVAQGSRLTGDRARDLAPDVRELAAARREREGESGRLARWPRERVPMDAQAQALVLAESLPIGLRVVADVAESSARAS